jgi:hypothetical protein
MFCPKRRFPFWLEGDIEIPQSRTENLLVVICGVCPVDEDVIRLDI